MVRLIRPAAWGHARAYSVSAIVCWVLRGCLAITSAYASDLSATIPDCPIWLSEADAFQDECLGHAREFTTTFYPGGLGRGEQERHAVLFAPAPSNQHFLMGCTLKFDRTVRFLGLYYTLEPSAIAQANTAPIEAVGFDGDVTLAVDGHPVTFVAVRPFETKKVKTFWAASSDTSKNCEDPAGQGQAGHALSGLFADFSRFTEEGIVEVGFFPHAMNAYRYIELFPSKAYPELLYSWFATVLVTTSGSVFIRRAEFPKTCHEGEPSRVANSSLLLDQLCRLLPPTGTQQANPE